jgi:hypothetical protein
MGIYSIKENRVIFEPQFLDVSFNDDGKIKVRVFDDKFGYNIEKILDRFGNQEFLSCYSSIYLRHNCGDYYEVEITENGDRLYGIIDKRGNEIVPCKYNSAWNGFLLDRQQVIYKQNELYGLMALDGEIVFPAEFSRFSKFNDHIFIVKKEGKEMLIDEGMCGLISACGETILPIEFSSISLYNDIIIARNCLGTTLYKIIS